MPYRMFVSYCTTDAVVATDAWQIAFEKAMREHEASMASSFLFWVGHGLRPNEGDGSSWEGIEDRLTEAPMLERLEVEGDIVEIRRTDAKSEFPSPPDDICVALAAEADMMGAYVSQNGGWGRLTGVMEVGDVSDGRLLACRRIAQIHDDRVGIDLATLLLSVDESERKKLRAWWYGRDRHATH